MIKFFQKLLAVPVGALCHWKAPKPLLNFAIRVYSRHYDISMDDYLFDINKATCFDDFFTRGLKVNAREIGDGIVSPVDATIFATGNAENGCVLQVKGQSLQISQLLTKEIQGNYSFISMYLSPADYHRYHAPADLKIDNIIHVPGKFHSVCPAVARRKKVFLLNERVVLECNSNLGKIYIVFIAAQNVGKIGLTALNGKCPISKNVSYIKPTGKIEYKKGEDLGAFHMGSSVVMILENANICGTEGQKLKMGESLSC